LLFYQPLEGYCYNSDSIFLYAFAKRFVKKGSLLDVGAGCGVIGLLLAKCSDVELSLAEREDMMVEFSRKNSEVNNIKATIYHGDFLESSFRDKFDYIVSNPPFYDKNTLPSSNHSLKSARHSTSLPFESMLAKINSIIKPRGEFIFCYESRSVATVCELLKKYKFGIERIVFVHPKVTKNSTIFFCRAKKGSKSQLTIEPPFVVFDQEGYTKEAKAVYEGLKTHTLKCQI